MMLPTLWAPAAGISVGQPRGLRRESRQPTQKSQCCWGKQVWIPLSAQHLPYFLMNEPELWAHTASVSGQADERGWSPPKLSTRLQGTWIQTANPWKTCQGQWPHICRGQQEAAAAAIPALEGTQEVSSMLMCAVPACPVLAGDGVRSKLNHAIPALPRVAPRLVIGMNIYWGNL